MTKPAYEMRYTEGGGLYSIQRWHKDRGAEPPRMAMPTLMMPEWLTVIINTARIGKRLRIVGVPPPEFICWFTTDDDYNLISFLEMDE